MAPTIAASRPIALAGPVLVTRSSAWPPTSTVPLRVSSPAILSTGTDSPVRTDSSMLTPRACSRVASAGTRSPASSRPVSPGTSTCVGRRTSRPSLQHPGGARGQRLQATHRRFRSAFLVQAQGGVQQQDEADGGRLDGPRVQTVAKPQPHVEREREEQDVDERVFTLGDKTVAIAAVARPREARLVQTSSERTGSFVAGEPHEVSLTCRREILYQSRHGSTRQLCAPLPPESPGDR